MVLADAAPLLTLFAQRGNNAGGDAGGAAAGLACMLPCFLVFGLLFLLVFAIMWKVFAKAGRPGWEALVPIYNSWVLTTEICKKEPLWFILQFVPIANIVASWVLSQELAKKFGKSETFGIGIFFLSPIFLAILAFGDARYQGGRGGLSRRTRDDYDDEDEDYDDRPRRGRADDDDDDRPRGRR